MSCSLEEIERKRKEALQKLAKKGLSPVKQNQHLSTSNPVQIGNSPKFKHTKFNSNKFQPYTIPQQQSSLQFYGPKDKTTTIKLLLKSENIFEANVEFNQVVINIFKEMPTRNFDPVTKCWSFQISDYDALVNALQKLPNCIIERIPLFVLKCLKNNSCNSKELDFTRIELDLCQSLLPFQIEGVSFGISRNGRCLIADDMGLGKTFQALAIMSYYSDDWPLLIATTASMRNVWEETIFKYLPSISMMHVQYMTSSKDGIYDSKILIVSHDLMGRCQDMLLERHFGALIIDESHVLKNYKTRISKAACALAGKAKRVVLLSGTPALSRPSELYTQLDMIDSKFFGTFFEYSKRYCDGQQTRFGWKATGQSNLKELEIILSRKFMIRRTKEDILSALPSKTQEIVKLDVHLEKLKTEEKECLEALAKQYKSETKGQKKHAILLSFFSETAKIKIPSVCSYVLQVLETQQKFLFFAHHQNMLDAVEKIVEQKNIKYMRIDGNTTSEQRKYYVDKFQLDDNYKVALLSITAANAGLTLTAAQLVLFGELHWNPSILAQAEARAHRIGQENKVIVQYLLANNTADDSIWPMLQEKERILKEVGLSRNTLENLRYQHHNKHNENVAHGLSATKNNLMPVKTKDISSYFDSPFKNGIVDDDDVFNDGLDELLSNIEIPDS